MYIIREIEGIDLSGYGVKRICRIYKTSGIKGETKRGNFTVKEAANFLELNPGFEIPDINLFKCLSEDDWDGSPSPLSSGTYWIATTFPWIQPLPEDGHHYICKRTRNGWATRQIKDEEKAGIIVVAK